MFHEGQLIFGILALEESADDESDLMLKTPKMTLLLIIIQMRSKPNMKMIDGFKIKIICLNREKMTMNLLIRVVVTFTASTMDVI